MGEKTKQKLRERIIIDRSFQFRYLIFCLALTAVLLLLFSGVMLIVVKRLSGWWASPLVIEEVVRLLVANGLFILLVGVSMGVYALFISHRIAGPAFRLETAIRQMLKGDYEQEIKLRRKDYLSNIASVLNDLLKRLRSIDRQRANIHENALKLKEALGKEESRLRELVENIIVDSSELKE
jgi:methyl-accepting chemotaxis protein